MYNNEDFADFFKNGFTSEYSNYCSGMIRAAVTGIMATCGSAKDYASENEYNDHIRKQCSKLMRTAEICSALTEEANTDEAVNIGEFIDEIIRGIKGILGSRCDMSYIEERPCYMRTSKRILRYIIIETVRKMVENSAESKLDVTFSACETDSGTEIKISGGTIAKDENRNDIFSSNYFNIVELFAFRINAKMVYNENTVTICLPVSSSGKVLELRSKKNFFGADNNSVYRLMLGDL